MATGSYRAFEKIFREKATMRRIDIEREKFRYKSFEPDSIKVFRYDRSHSIRLTQMQFKQLNTVISQKNNSSSFLYEAILAI